MAGGDVCALTLRYTHIQATADVFISANTRAHARTPSGGRRWQSGRPWEQSEVGPQVV